MLELFNFYCRCLVQSPILKNITPFKTLPFLTLLSQLHIHSDFKPLLWKLQKEQVNDELEKQQSPPMVPQMRVLQRQEIDGSPELRRGFSGISHPWPEWVDLMELLINKGYFDKMGDPFRNWEMSPKSLNLVRTACLNFGRDRFDLIRHLSKKDIQVIVAFGCLDIDRKVINSGKRLRAYVGINEGNTCSSCSLRGDCERAYVKAREEEGARTVDVMRILLTFGLDSAAGLVENKQCQNKTVEESVIRLVKQIVGLCHENIDPTYLMEGDLVGQDNLRTIRHGQIKILMQQGDWICPMCNFLNFAKNIKCLCCNGLFQDKVRQITEGQDHLPLKKGDWICDRCNFLNFAKNSKCLICQGKPPKRHLGPGEWECDSCHYINFRKNSACLRCDHKRPKASSLANPLIKTASSNFKYHRIAQESVGGQEGGRQKKNLDQVEPMTKNDALMSMNFPILGGRSTMSCGKQDIEEWKLKMRERERSLVKAGEKREFDASVVGSPKFLEFTDDDEGMEEWFQQKAESERLYSDSDEN